MFQIARIKLLWNRIILNSYFVATNFMNTPNSINGFVITLE